MEKEVEEVFLEVAQNVGDNPDLEPVEDIPIGHWIVWAWSSVPEGDENVPEGAENAVRGFPVIHCPTEKEAVDAMEAVEAGMTLAEDGYRLAKKSSN